MKIIIGTFILFSVFCVIQVLSQGILCTVNHGISLIRYLYSIQNEQCCSLELTNIDTKF